MTAVLTPLSIRLSHRFGVLDLPGERKIHDRPMPLLGGVGIFLAFLVLAAAAPLLLHQLRDVGPVRSHLPAATLPYVDGFYVIRPWVLTIAAGGLGMFLIGLADDLMDVPVRWRLLLETLVATSVAFVGVRFRLAGSLPGLAVLEIPLTVVWIVGIANALNLLDGLDGLAAGVAALSAGLLAVVMIVGQQPLVAGLLLIFAGSLIGFLAYNFHPARVFLGSNGSIFIGYLLAVAVLFSDFILPQSQTLFPILVPVLVLGLPIYDTASVIGIRLAGRRSILRADMSHVHHRLLRLGLGRRGTCLFLYLFHFAVGVNAILLVGVTLLESLVLLVQIVALLGLFALLEASVSRPSRGGDG